MLRLYTQSRNSAGERVRIALHLKGISYAYVAMSSLPRGEYRRLNPQGLMPALEVDGRVIAQSTAILEYLEETRPTPPLLPVDPIARAEVRGFAQLIASDLHPLNNHRVRKFLGTELGASAAAILAWYRHWVQEGLQALEVTLARRPASRFCFADQPGWAEIHLVPQLATARRFGCDLRPYPRLLGVEALCLEISAFRKARPDAQPDFTGDIEAILRPH
jgi:maleylacetoacetate isomerase